MKILLYYPSNKRTISLETLLKELIKLNHEVFLMTTCEAGEFHQQAKLLGVKCYSHEILKGNTLVYHLKQILFLTSFCKKHQIDVVFSHLQQVNLIAVVAQYLIRAKVVVFRHHDYARNASEARADQIINRLARAIVVPSSGVLNLMLKNEKVDQAKLSIIPYIYDFDAYKKPDKTSTERIKEAYDCDLLLIMVSRLVPQKRHLVAFEVLSNLVREGHRIKMLVMDTGYDEVMLKQFIIEKKLQRNIFMMGFKTDIIDYMNAADVLVHISNSEASCSAVKEAALMKKLVIACHEVGDFDDYMVDQKNGFLLDLDQTSEQLYDTLKNIYEKKNELNKMGENLYLTVMDRFSTSNKVMQQYEELIYTF